jgi:DNA polymerase-3 subunit beta
MAITDKMVRFQCQDITLFSRRIEGRFPKWRNIIPETENQTPVIVECGSLLPAIMQAQVTTSEHDPGVNLTFEKGKLILNGEGKERGNSKIEIPLAFSDAPKTLKFDPKYLTDFLKALDSNAKVSIYLPPDNDPTKITADDGGYVYVVMPVCPK